MDNIYKFEKSNKTLIINVLEDVLKCFTTVTTVLIIQVSFIANILSETPSVRNLHHIETNQPTWSANQPQLKSSNDILRIISNENEIHTNIKRSEMKELLLLYTITIYNNIYQQSNDVAMGCPLGPVIAGIFMVQLERTLKLIEYVTP